MLPHPHEPKHLPDCHQPPCKAHREASSKDKAATSIRGETKTHLGYLRNITTSGLSDSFRKKMAPH